MSLLIYVIGLMQLGLGVLLNVLLAMLSILAPGRLAIFFASVASCTLLAINFFEYQNYLKISSNLFFSTGIYGAGFFATALTAWYFSNWVRVSENLARSRGRELYSMQQLNEYIVERLQYGVIYVAADSSVKVINNAARKFFNFDSARKNINISDLSPVLYQKYKHFLTKKKKDNLVLHTVLDSPYLQVHFYSASLAEQQAVLIILDDMAALAQQAQQLKLASLGRFSASIAHELRNPLGVVSHAVQLIQDGERFNEEDSRLFQLVLNNCHRMNSVIQNVLQVSRRQQAKPKILALTPFLNQFKQDFCLINSCTISLNIPQNKKKTVLFDRGHLEQVLVNLCDNAMVHGRDAQGRVNISITLKHEDPYLMLLVSDMGPGIINELHNDVFEPFFSTTTTGTGMGLFIAKDLCEINQARLTIMKIDKGCCFGIFFHQNHEIKL
jgi:two-component system sensor histidine kinase PilS (NtrC family)